ncbi:MAG: transporter substrate-binding domain-containing protein [Chlamydiia bacterium]|nr:transporter substrate-binding domain-containing protein [Chlamydiia bacterium]
MMKRILMIAVLATLFVSCATKGKTYRIGIDPSYYPAQFSGKEANVYAFSKELLRAISAEEGVFFETVGMSWDNLVFGLKDKKYEGILSAMTPRIHLERTYRFSESFLSTGPVLVVRKGIKVSHVNHLKGKEVGVSSLNSEALLIEKYPGVEVHYYTSVPDSLDEIIAQQIDGILIDAIPASSYVRGLYFGQLSIATPPLNDEGLRLVTPVGEEKELVEVFNRGLEKLRSNGTYDKLLKKWELN